MEAQCLATRMQVIALTHELTTRPARIGNSTMGTRLRDGHALRDAQVWLARTQDDLGIQVRQAHLSISSSQVVSAADPEHLSLMISLSWFHLTILTYIPDVPGERQGPALPVDRWVLLRPHGGSAVQYPPLVRLSVAELNATITGQTWLPWASNRGVRVQQGV
jgi:hypothetical protein